MSIIKSYRSPKIEIRGSEKQGKGLFAEEDIKEGEIVFIKNGHIVNHEEMMELEERLGEYSLQITDDFYLCSRTQEEVESTAIFINHSCDPNVGPDGQVSFVALRDIEFGEELCYDYAMTTDRDYSLDCNCGSQQCRGVITGKDWQLEELQDRYGDNFAWFILKKIRSSYDS